MNEVPAWVVYLATGTGALFFCVVCHLGLRIWQGRAKGVGGRGKRGKPGGLEPEVNGIIEELTLLAATPGRLADDPETDAVLRRVTELSLQHVELAGPMAGHVSGLRKARTAEETGVKLRALLEWIKANRTALSAPTHEG
ncbi:MAG: hypothetical protein SNJ84_06525 [Verrucomicrobiia bacterium]